MLHVTRSRGESLSALCKARIEMLLHCLNSTRETPGEIWECGVYRGGSALCMKAHIGDASDVKTMRLFDTFEGIPVKGAHDIHPIGAFNETSEASVRALFEGASKVDIYKGLIPNVFAGLEDATISMAHIDVDQYQAVLDCLTFIYPRMPKGGIIVLDDYACPGCPGATIAVNEFLEGKPERIAITGGTPQAWFVKGEVV